MNISLYGDGSYRIYRKHPEKVFSPKKKKSLQYALLDTTTSLKGENFVLVKQGKKNPIDPIRIHVGLTLRLQSIFLYCQEDTPWTDSMTRTQSFHITTIEQAYGFYSMLTQLLNYDTFKGQYLGFDNFTDLDQITLTIGARTYELSPDVTDQEIEDIFRPYGWKTDLFAFLGYDKYLVLDEKKGWYRSTKVPDTFQYLGVQIFNAEMLYLLSWEEVHLLKAVRGLSIVAYDYALSGEEDSAVVRSMLRNGELYLDDLLYNMFIYKQSIESLCDLVFFIPQFINLERQVLSTNISLQFLMTLEGGEEVELWIDAEDMPHYGICLRSIFFSWLQEVVR